MGLYSKYLFPRLVDWMLGSREIGELRSELLGETAGKVLEIGFGTGLNLSHYPAGVERLTIVDPNPGMLKRAASRLQGSSFPVERHRLSGERLPFPEENFDSAVSTFTLCSIAGVENALAEVRRVLKTGGKFFFLEHGLSPKPRVSRWQDRLTPLQKIVGDGCHLNRPVDRLVEAAPLKIVRLKKFYFEKFPKIFGYFYLGVAQKP